MEEKKESMDESEFHNPLVEAVEKGDVDAVQKLLEDGNDPNDYEKDDQTLMEFALSHKNIEIVKLLFLYGGHVESDFLKEVFKMENTDHVQELILYFIQLGKDDKAMLKNISCQVFESSYKGPPALKILKLLLDSGLDANCSFSGVPILHCCVFKNKTNFVNLLLARGADINAKTVQGLTPLHIATASNNEDMVRLLLKNHALVNETFTDGQTALHVALKNMQSYTVVNHLLSYDADLNVLSDAGHTPLYYSSMFFSLMLIKHLAKFSCQFNRPVCNENIEYLRGKNLLKDLEDCLDELKRMKEQEVYNGISLYDIFKMPKYSIRLTHLTMNKDFNANFWTTWNRNFFSNYRNDLDNTFTRAVGRRDCLQAEEKKLNSIFKDVLPELIIRRIAYINKMDLFFD